MKLTSITLYILFFIAIGLPVRGFAQQDSIPVKDLVEKNNNYITQFPNEAVHLHLDKPYYALGDTVWFKAYVSTIQHYPSPLSKILYVDLINADNEVSKSIKLPVQNSTASGNIPLDAMALKQGNFRLRAYTRWMLNYDLDYFFEKNLIIGNAINKDFNTHIEFATSGTGKRKEITAYITFRDEEYRPLRNKRISWEAISFLDRLGRGRGTTNDDGVLEIKFTAGENVDLEAGEIMAEVEVNSAKTVTRQFSLKSLDQEYDIQFFPEGGSLIESVASQVAFKAIQKDGAGVSVSGRVVDSKGNTVTEFKSQHLGMGKFDLLPVEGESYTAELTYADGSTSSVTLPKVESKGIRLSADSSDPDDLSVKVNMDHDFLKAHFNTGFYIVGRNEGNVFYAAQSVFRSQEYVISVPKLNFPSGIVQLSLLSRDGRVLSERLVFVRRPDTLNLQLSSDQEIYKPRGKINMHLESTLNGEAATGNFSVSVLDETKLPVDEDKEASIWSSLLIQSQLQGYIEDANYYFHHVSPEKDAHLDLLMLTQGYRKYTYQSVIQDTPPNIAYLPEQGLQVSGMIRRSDGLPLQNTPILLQIPEKSFYREGTTDQEGRYNFDHLLFEDSVKVVVNARNVRDKNLIITVDGAPFPATDPNPILADQELNIDSALQNYLIHNPLQNSTGFLLDEVNVAARAKRPSHADHSTLSGLNMLADYQTDGEQLGGCNDLLSCMSTVMGLTYVENNLYLSTVYNAGGRIPVAIFVNGMEVDVNYLYGLQPSGVDNIEVFREEGLSGINQRSNTQGVVIINMKEVKTESMSMEEFQKLFPPSNTMTFTPQGFSEQMQFYAPKYDGPRNNLQSKDMRTTIHWNPYLITNGEGKVDFSYFAADDPGTYRILVEGFTEDGILGRAIYKVQVQQ